MVRSGVRGVKETARNIRKLPRTMRKPVSDAARIALKPILVDAKAKLVANGSKKRGVLFRSMAIRQKKAGRGFVETVVAATGRGTKTAHLVEFGTEPHFQPKRGTMHPGSKAKPFLTPAYAKNEQRAIRKFGDVIGGEIEKQARKLANRR